MINKSMQTHSEENHLKTIFNLGNGKDRKVSVTNLAAALGNNPASIVDMLKKLVEKKLIMYDKKNGVRLTKSGLQVALQTIRRHRLWEKFLMDKLGYSWDEVHDIAEELEHVQGKDLADRLDLFLGYPGFDPHGEVIPGSDGRMPEIFEMSLESADTGKYYKVVAVKDTSSAFLKYLEKLKIRIGSVIMVMERIEFDDSMVIRKDRKKTTISRRLASGILVKNQA